MIINFMRDVTEIKFIVIVVNARTFTYNLTEHIRLPYDISAGVKGLEPPFIHYGLTA